MIIKEMPTAEKPRERLIAYGKESLSNEELLAIILRTGTKNKSAKEVALAILKDLNHINELNTTSINKLSKINGVGKIKALTIIASLELGKRVYAKKDIPNIKLNNTDLVYSLFQDKFKDINQEQLIAIYLNNKNKIIEYKTIFIGTVNASIAHPREILKEALNLSATSFIVIHNHPSGDPTPSIADISFTIQIEKSANIIDIKLIDHLIFGNNTYSSYRNDKWVDNNAKIT